MTGGVRQVVRLAWADREGDAGARQKGEWVWQVLSARAWKVGTDSVDMRWFVSVVWAVIVDRGLQP